MQNEKIDKCKSQRFKFKICKLQSMRSMKYSPASESYQQDNYSRLNDTIFTKQLLKRLQKYNDDEQISLEQSIPILYDLNIFQELTSIPEAKKRLTQNCKPNHRLQLEARFVYNLWKLISQQYLSMAQFKRLVVFFITQEISDLAQKLQQVFQNQNETLIQILAIWEAMLQNNSHSNFHQDLKESSLITDQQGNSNQARNSHNNKKSSSQNSQNYSSNKMNRNRQISNKNSKENQSQYQSQSTSNKPQTQRYYSKTRRQNIEEVKNQIYINNLYELPVLSVEKQKELINRLYVVNKYDRYQELKKIQDQEKILKQMQQCTFRPNIDKNKKPRPDSASRNNSSRNSAKPIPGYQKAIQRMKIGQQKTKQLKQKLQLRKINFKSIKQENLKMMAPPKFLTRETKKEEKRILFTIQFDIGRHKLSCKIYENESAQQLARNIQSIYSLKQDSYEQIKEIIEQQMQRYYELNRDVYNQNGNVQDQRGQEDERIDYPKSNLRNLVC